MDNSSDSELELSDLPVLAKGPQLPLEVVQRKEIEALRLQVLEKASENSILTARMRDIDDVYSKRLNEQVMNQTSSREAQAAEVDAIKRELNGLRRKNSFLEMEVKTLETKGASGSPNPAISHPIGDGFVVKRRRVEDDLATEPFSKNKQCRVHLAKCVLANGDLAIEQLGVKPMVKLLEFDSVDEAANYLLDCLQSLPLIQVPACLRLLAICLDYANADRIKYQPLVSTLASLLTGLKPFPELDTPGNIYLDRENCFRLTSLLYTIDILISSSPGIVPYELTESLIRHKNALISHRGIVLLTMTPQSITERNILADTAHASTKPSIELLFGGLWDEKPVDATLLGFYSEKLLQLSLDKRDMMILCENQARKVSLDLNTQIIQAILAKPTTEPALWHKAVSILLAADDDQVELIKICLYFIWRTLPITHDSSTQLYSSLLTTTLSRVASLTSDQDTNYWAQEILRQIVHPSEDEILRSMMCF